MSVQETEIPDRCGGLANRDDVAGLYLTHHPNAQRDITFPDFQFLRLEVDKARRFAVPGHI
ncbi:MAG: hypothetical protein ACK2UH_10110 [Candidatus Promineifilaceae bacterium]